VSDTILEKPTVHNTKIVKSSNLGLVHLHGKQSHYGFNPHMSMAVTQFLVRLNPKTLSL
jgi:hypothetical protein